MINCIIIDDEPLALDLLEDYISKVPFLSLLARCDCAAGAMSVIEDTAPDLIFLDINMPDVNGIQLIKGLLNLPSVVITTAHPQYAVDGFDLHVNDFLLKPISFERFLRAVNRVKDTLQNPTPVSDIKKTDQDFLFIKTDYKLTKVNLTDIKYLEGLKDYVKVITEGKTYITRQTLKLFEEKLPVCNFIRVHRSFIVSIKHITAITKNRIIIDKEYIPISELYHEAFFELIKNKS
jgi:DNA-binding LytR/AlgR family response regulator